MMNNLPKHVAFIMDGNARWAKINNVTKAAGHKAGSMTAKMVVETCLKIGIKYVTLYTFSSENWQRPVGEIKILMNLLTLYIKREIKNIISYGVKLNVVGNRSNLPDSLNLLLDNAIEETKNNDKMSLSLAISYGGRQEIIDACQKVINNGVDIVTEELFKDYMYDPCMPDVDLMIRTGGMLRISNFLLWQMAYAELLFLEKYWPDLLPEDIERAIDDYQLRIRNFGARSD
jgi:undecaprenyl diphosphate synthase